MSVMPIYGSAMSVLVRFGKFCIYSTQKRIVVSSIFVSVLFICDQSSHPKRPRGRQMLLNAFIIVEGLTRDGCNPAPINEKKDFLIFCVAISPRPAKSPGDVASEIGALRTRSTVLRKLPISTNFRHNLKIPTSCRHFYSNAGRPKLGFS